MAEGGGHDWTQEYYPIAWLPYHVRQEIATFLDTGTGDRGFEMFASLLRFTAPQTSNLRVRGAHRDFNYSPTIALFAEMDAMTIGSRYCIQLVYRILLQMRSGAADVIIKWLPDILRNKARPGQQDNEPSLCICEQCRIRQIQSHTSIGNYPRRPDTLGNAPNEQTLHSSNSSQNTASMWTSYTQARRPNPHHPQSQPRMGPIFERHGVEPPTINEDIHSGLPEPQQNSISMRQTHLQNEFVTSNYSSVLYTSDSTRAHSDQSNQQHNSIKGDSSIWSSPESLDVPTSSSPGRVSASDVDQSATSFVPQSVNASNPVGSATANVSRARNSSGHEKMDYIRNGCEQCRLASDSDQTAVLRTYSEPKNSCALHSNSEENPVMPHNTMVRGIRTQNSDEDASVGADINGSLGINWQNLDVNSVNGQQNQYDHHSVNGSWSVNSQINRGGDIHNQLDGDEGEIVPKTMNSIPRYDGFPSRCNRQINTNGYSDQDQTYVKTSHMDDETEKFERLTLNCPECEKENSAVQMKELKSRGNTCRNSNSVVTQTQPSGNGSGNSHISPVRHKCTGNYNHMLNCDKCHQEAAFSHQSRRQMQEFKQTGNNGRRSTILDTRKEDRHSWPDGELINQHSSSGSLSGSNSDPSVMGTQSDISNVSSANSSSAESSSAESRSSMLVLVTFSVSSDQARSRAHMDEVLKLIKALQKENIRVKVDMDQPTFEKKGWNRMDWLDRVLKRASFIIACITPEYAQDIEPNDGAVAQVSQLNARYIYDHMRKEFYNNQARNRRIIPVLFPNSGAVYNNVPQCMNATSVYTYSEDVGNIIELIKR